MPQSEPETTKFVPALIVIDMQNDFVSGALPVPGGATIIDTVNKLIELPFKLKIATRDYHPDDHVSFAKTHDQDVFSKKIIFHPEDADKLVGIEQMLWPVHCVENTNGAEFVPGLETTKFDSVVYKGTHPRIESYSAFSDIWGRGTTELPDLLAEKGVTDLYFVGLAGDYCVKYTALDGLDLGYNVWLVSDAIKSISDQEIAFSELQKQGMKNMYKTGSNTLSHLLAPTTMSEDSLCQSAGPPFGIRILAQIMTGLHFIESVGATIILWFYPSLAPEPRIHQYIASTPTHHSQRSIHHHHHHHHRRSTHRRDRVLADDSETYFAPSTSATDSSGPTTPEADDRAYTSESVSDTRDLGVNKIFEVGDPLLKTE